MYESDIQSAITNAIIDREVDDIQVELSDTENTVVIDTAEGEALYTANETRQLATTFRQSRVTVGTWTVKS